MTTKRSSSSRRQTAASACCATPKPARATRSPGDMAGPARIPSRRCSSPMSWPVTRAVRPAWEQRPAEPESPTAAAPAMPAAVGEPSRSRRRSSAPLSRRARSIAAGYSPGAPSSPTLSPTRRTRWWPALSPEAVSTPSPSLRRGCRSMSSLTLSGCPPMEGTYCSREPCHVRQLRTAGRAAAEPDAGSHGLCRVHRSKRQPRRARPGAAGRGHRRTRWTRGCRPSRRCPSWPRT